MHIDVLTLFPEALAPFFGSSIVGRAISKGLVKIACTSYRDFTHDKHRSVDDRPFGGGPGMLMTCGPVYEAVEHVTRRSNGEAHKILLTPQGERLNQSIVAELATEKHLVLLCGHYEGFDERIRVGLEAREISIGDFILSGGEAAALVLVDAVVRLLPGVLGHDESTLNESFSSGLLEHPQFTRPRSFRGMEVPEVLLSGDHARLEAWKQQQALERTRRRRPDLLSSGERPHGVN